MTKQRLIDANRLYEKATDAYDHTLCDVCYSEIINLIDEAPTVDAVEVVRCKECAGWCPEEIAKRYGVDRYCTLTRIPTNAEDFCSYGERRDEDEKKCL